MRELIPIPDGPWLNVGSGPANASQWINIDGSWQARLAGNPWLVSIGRYVLGTEIGHWPAAVKYRDIRRGLGYGKDAVAVVYASHVVEHLYRDEAQRFLRDVYRSLKPRGVCRIVVPDLAAIVGWYLEHRRQPAVQRTEPSSDLLMSLLLLRTREAQRGRGPLAWVRRGTDLHQHKWMYDQEGLQTLFSEAGFSNPEPRGFLDSAIARAQLEMVEHQDRICGGAGVCMEARK